MSAENPTTHTNMRLPVDLLAWIDSRAKTNEVTRTTQVIRMLEYTKQAVEEQEQADALHA